MAPSLWRWEDGPQRLWKASTLSRVMNCADHGAPGTMPSNGRVPRMFLSAIVLERTALS